MDRKPEENPEPEAMTLVAGHKFPPIGIPPPWL